jgi:hypothetical protein
MKEVLLCGIALLATWAFASASRSQTCQYATVLKIKEEDSQPTYIGSNPSDAPLRSPTYSYKAQLRMDCVTYVARYESWSDQPDPMCAPNRVIAVNIQKHARAVKSSGKRR